MISCTYSPPRMAASKITQHQLSNRDKKYNLLILPRPFKAFIPSKVPLNPRIASLGLQWSLIRASCLLCALKSSPMGKSTSRLWFKRITMKVILSLNSPRTQKAFHSVVHLYVRSTVPKSTRIKIHPTRVTLNCLKSSSTMSPVNLIKCSFKTTRVYGNAAHLKFAMKAKMLSSSQFRTL